MKIKCSYCENYFNDTLAKCPSCGAPNDGVIRSASSDPKTISELQAWYKSKGLPPAETTRFFIGVDYKKPRAFGIYQDENSGNFVVYKNKDNGERAIRYQGTDEAYAVNELYQRLKQEIIQQKMSNVKKTGASPTRANANNREPMGILKSLGWLLVIPVVSALAVAFIILIVGIWIVIFVPEDGYYNYQGSYYYYDDSGHNDKYVFEYDSASGDWKEPVGKKDDPGIFRKKRTAKAYYISSDWDSSLECSNISDSIIYKDFEALSEIVPGYFATSDGYYYHYGFDYDTDWYYYDSYSDWVPVNTEALPADLAHPSEVNDFFYTSTWDPSVQFTDFTESEEYQEHYSSSDSSDSDYDWDSSDSWDSGGTDWGSDW